MISIQHDSENSMFFHQELKQSPEFVIIASQAVTFRHSLSLANGPSFLPRNCAALSRKEADAVTGGVPRGGLCLLVPSLRYQWALQAPALSPCHPNNTFS